MSLVLAGELVVVVKAEGVGVLALRLHTDANREAVAVRIDALHRCRFIGSPDAVADFRTILLGRVNPGNPGLRGNLQEFRLKNAVHPERHRNVHRIIVLLLEKAGCAELPAAFLSAGLADMGVSQANGGDKVEVLSAEDVDEDEAGVVGHRDLMAGEGRIIRGAGLDIQIADGCGVEG